MRSSPISFILLFSILSKSQVIAGNPKGKGFYFRENKGQVFDQYLSARPEILFSGGDGGFTFHLKKNGISYQISKTLQVTKFNSNAVGRNPAKESMGLSISRIDINWLNTTKDPVIEKGAAQTGYENFYGESCPNGALFVRSYNEVGYQNIYPNIDLRWFSLNGKLKYEYIVAPFSNYRAIQSEIVGAKKIRIDEQGRLIITTENGQIVEDVPFVFQDDQVLTSHWDLNGNIVSYIIDGVNNSKPFTIDPLVRSWGTYFGGSQEDAVGGINVDPLNNVIIVGQTKSPTTANIATTGAHQVTFGGTSLGAPFGDAYVTKYNSAGVRIWSTYYGGSDKDAAFGCATDQSGNIYVTGVTSSTNNAVMTTQGCYQMLYAGGVQNGDAFLVKFNASGVRAWGTYYGSESDEIANSVCIDLNGDLYVCGATQQSGMTTLSTVGAFQASHSGGGFNWDGFLAKFSATGSRIWGTYFGDIGNDIPFYCQADLQNNIVMVGYTNSQTSTIIASPNCHQPSLSNSSYDGFIEKFSSSGSRLWGTYYGGGGTEIITNCSIASGGDIYVAGKSSTPTSTLVATNSGFQPIYGGGNSDVFLAKFNSNGLRQWGSYYGGSGSDDVGYCALDGNGNVYLTGLTSTSVGTAIATPCTYQTAYGGAGTDCFLAKFDQQGIRLWGTYYGGAGTEYTNTNNIGPCVAVDNSNAVYLCGTTSSGANVMTSTGAEQANYGGGAEDTFLARFAGCTPDTPPPINLTACRGQPAVLNAPQSCMTKWYSDSVLTNLIYLGPVFTTNNINNDTVFYFVDFSCGIESSKAVAHLTVIPSPTVTIITSNSLICNGDSVSLSSFGADQFSWLNIGQGASISVTPSATIIYTLIGMFLNSCASSTTATIEVNDCTGLKKLDQLSRALRVFPNPSNGFISIFAEEEYNVSLIDNLGSNRMDFQILNGENLIDIRSLANGVYFMFSKNDQSRSTHKIILNR
jgi:hypothetical protein